MVLWRTVVPCTSVPLQVMRGTVENCGTMYFNIAAYAQTLPALLDFADARRWRFDHDQVPVWKLVMMTHVNRADSCCWGGGWGAWKCGAPCRRADRHMTPSGRLSLPSHRIESQGVPGG